MGTSMTTIFMSVADSDRRGIRDNARVFQPVGHRAVLYADVNAVLYWKPRRLENERDFGKRPGTFKMYAHARAGESSD